MNSRELLKWLGRAVNRCVPKCKHKILFESNSDFCDNTRALYDYLIQSGYGQKYRFVWCVHNPKTFHAEKMPCTKLASFQKASCLPSYFFHIMTSKYVFYTHNPPPFCNPKAQTVLNLWHGTPLKSIKGHVHPAKLFTDLLSPSAFFDPILEDSFDALPSQMLHFGYPRCDLLFDQTDVLQKLRINRLQYQKILLWMPTFRRPEGGFYTDAETTLTGLPLIDTPEMFGQLNEKLREDELLLIIKLHPGQDMSGIRLLSLSNMKMLTNQALDDLKIQTYHLVGACDALVTDYSSIYFDYLLLNRPIAFLIDDFDEYRKNRGFTVDDPLSMMPGPKIRTISELYGFFDDLKNGRDDYAAERERVSRIANEFHDPNSAKRIAEYFLGKSNA